MDRIRNIFRKLVAGEEGAALVEYGLLVALIAVAAILAITAVGTNISALFNTVAGKLVPTP
jgi:pilus assembly protein Flp/PilA